MFIRDHNGHKFRIYTANNEKTIIAVASYAGKVVRGIAKCNPEDKQDSSIGIKLAILRCDHKIAERKKARANKRINEIKSQVDALTKKYVNAVEKYKTTIDECTNAKYALENFINGIKD